jgi:hypothetical protein
MKIKKIKQVLKLKFNQSGQAFVLALIALSVVTIGVVALLSGTLTLKQNSRYTLDSLEASGLAEAGIDKAVASLNKSAGQYTGETNTAFGNGTYTVQIDQIDSNTSKITATGYVPNAQSPKSQKKISVQIQRGDGMSFAYGIQAGEGGFVMGGGSRVNGSVYSNNDITISSGALITGDAYVAGGTQPNADQQAECITPNCSDYIFGKNVSGSNILDVAQSFRPTTTGPINKISLKIKKIGTSHPNLTVRILSDNNGKPNKNNPVTSGTLNSILVTSTFNFVDIGLVSNPVLTANTPYWIMIDTTSNSSNYWAWELDSLSGYNRGAASWSPDWQAGNPVWNAINGDFGFKTFMGGEINKITGNGSSNINGSAYANTMTGDNPSALQIGQHAYYQTESNIRVNGQNCSNNPNCHPGSPDPQPLVMPVSAANIQEWKDFAAQQEQTGNINIGWPCQGLASKKYIGNITIGGGCTVEVDSPIWITGNLSVGGGATVRLKPAYGSSSGIIVIDGTTNLAGGSTLRGSGTAGSYMMVISTNTNMGAPTYAVNVQGGNSSSILYVPYGAIFLSGGSNFREATGYKIVMDGGAVLTYETGVANPFFSSGPSGSFSVVKGTYQSE